MTTGWIPPARNTMSTTTTERDWLDYNPELREQSRRELDRDALMARLATLYHDHGCIACGDEWLCEGGCDAERSQLCEGCVVR